MEELEKWVNTLWNPYLLLLLTVVGVYCSLLTGFLQTSIIFCFQVTLGQIGKKQGEIVKKVDVLSQLSALCLALATTIGTGSIAGVATAIWWGGAGAVFWMWVSAFFGMIISAFEKVMTIQYRVEESTGVYVGGPMYYLEKGVGSKFLAKCFSIACIFASFTGGTVVQASSIAQGIQHLTPLPTLVTGLLLTMFVLFALGGGMNYVRKISTVLVPIMSSLYLGAGIFILLHDISATKQAFLDIFNSAFTTTSMVAGGGGYTVMMAIRYGMARGIFSNEAGLGAGAIAHGNARVDNPARQGMWGMVEVFFATNIVCTITALVILSSGIYQGDVARVVIETDVESAIVVGVPLTQTAFSIVLGEIGSIIVVLSLLLFAFTSILGWNCYGKQSLSYLTKNRLLHQLYGCVTVLCLLGGSVWGSGHSELIWILVDLSLAFMLVPNVVAVIVLAPQTSKMLNQWTRREKLEKIDHEGIRKKQNKSKKSQPLRKLNRLGKDRV